MSERALPVTKIVRLASGELAEIAPSNITPPIVALAILLLVGTAWWAVSGE